MIVFVGIGPGDPELMTLKAVRAIREADVIVMPDTGLGDSVATRITAQWIKDKPCVYVPMPMQGTRDNWEKHHETAARDLMDILARGKRIAYLVLGDPSIYATSGYLMARIMPHYPCEVIPGVPAMCAAAAAVRVPLTEGREPLTVLAGYAAGSPLPEGNVVIMKAKDALPDIQAALGGRAAYLARDLGMEGEYAGPLSQADQAAHSYFSTVIVKEQP